jgi:serine protease
MINKFKFSTRFKVLSLTFRRFTLCLAGFSCLVGTLVQAQEVPPQSTTTKQLIIHLRDDGVRGAASVKPADPVPGLTLGDGRHFSYVRSLDDGGMVVQLPEVINLEEANALVAELLLDPAVQKAQVDKRLYPALVPNDTNYADQWHLFEDTAGIRMESAWDQHTGSPGVVIAVLDTGVIPHAELTVRVMLLWQVNVGQVILRQIRIVPGTGYQ